MSGINRISTANVPQKSDRLVVGVVVLYIIMFALFTGLYALWVSNIELVNRWTRREQTCGRRLTLLVEEVPKTYCDERNFRKFWEDLYPGQIAGTSLLRDTGDLADLAKERNHFVRQYNHERGIMEVDFEGGFQRPKIKLNKVLKDVKADIEVDSQDFYLYHIQYLDEQLMRRSQYRYPVKNAGFVTFKTARAYAAALRMCTTSIPEKFLVDAAPEPREILWDGITRPRRWRQSMHGLMLVAHFFLVFFWIVPVGFVSSLTSLEALSSQMKWLKDITDASPAIRGFLQGFLPALAMIVFMAILPLILRTMAFIEGIESESKLDVFIFKRYFVFQLFNFFLVTCIAGSVLKQLDAIMNQPTMIVQLLASSLPQTADVFMSYILVRTLTAIPLELSMIVPLILKEFFRHFAMTPAEFLSLWAGERFFYGKNLPEMVLIAIIGIAFTPIQPLMPILCMGYFGFAYFSYKHQFIFMLVQPFETGGKHWPLIFNRIIFGSVIAQLTLIGLYGLKQSAPAYGLAAPLPIITFIYWYLLNGEFNSRYSSPSALDAARTDLSLSALDEKMIARLRRGPTLNPVGIDLEPFLMPDVYNLSSEAVENAIKESKNVVIVPKAAFVESRKRSSSQALNEDSDTTDSDDTSRGDAEVGGATTREIVDPKLRAQAEEIAKRLSAMGIDERYLACCQEEDEEDPDEDVLLAFRNRLAAVDAFTPSRLRTHAADFLYTPPTMTRNLIPRPQAEEETAAGGGKGLASQPHESQTNGTSSTSSGEDDMFYRENPDAIRLESKPSESKASGSQSSGLPALEYVSVDRAEHKMIQSPHMSGDLGTVTQPSTSMDAPDTCVDLTEEQREVLERARELETERRVMIRYLQPELAQELFGDVVEKVTWSARYLRYLEAQYKRSHPNYNLDAVAARNANPVRIQDSFVPPPALLLHFQKEEEKHRARMEQLLAERPYANLPPLTEATRYGHLSPQPRVTVGNQKNRSEDALPSPVTSPVASPQQSPLPNPPATARG